MLGCYKKKKIRKRQTRNSRERHKTSPRLTIVKYGLKTTMATTIHETITLQQQPLTDFTPGNCSEQTRAAKVAIQAFSFRSAIEDKKGTKENEKENGKTV